MLGKIDGRNQVRFLPKIFMNLLAVANTIRNAITSNRGNALIEEQNSLIKLQINAEHLKKYSDALIEQKNRIEPLMREIRDAARNSLCQVANHTDNYSQSNNGTATRHIFRNIVGHLFNAFSYEMPWQQTDNLYPRFRRIVDLQVDYKELNPNRNQINASESYEKQRHGNLEGELFGSKEFVKLLTEFFNRITSPEQLYQDVLNDVEPIFILLRDNKELIENEINTISSLRRSNDLEAVKIADDFKLFNEYKILESKLKFIERFYLIESWTKYRTEDLRLSQILVVGFFLIMLDRHELWGDYVGI
jgi:hypothetical protein